MSYYIFTKNQNKSGPILNIIEVKIRLVPNIYTQHEAQQLLLEQNQYFSQFSSIFCFAWKADQVNIKLVGLLRPKSGLFKQKKYDQFSGLFSKRSDIKPRSDIVDLLGSTSKIISVQREALEK